MRPVIQWFGQQVEAALQRNDGKPDWTPIDYSDLVTLLMGEVAELVVAVMQGSPIRIQEEAADVAAVAMFIADKSRAVPSSNRGRS